MSTRQMALRLQDALDKVLSSRGFVSKGELCWMRDHTPIGFDVLSAQLLTKHAPDFLQVSLHVGFSVPLIHEALTGICGDWIEDGKPVDRPLCGTLLVRTFDDPDRPKKRPPVPLNYTLWSVDFRPSVVERIVHDIQRFAVPYFDRFTSIGDLKNIAMSPDSHAVLLAYLENDAAALQYINDELKKTKRYGPEMRTRLERLHDGILSGALQKSLLDC